MLKKIISNTELDSVLEAFTESDTFGLKGLSVSLAPLLTYLTSMNQLLTTVSGISGIVWIWICIYYKIKNNKKGKEGDDE